MPFLRAKNINTILNLTTIHLRRALKRFYDVFPSLTIVNISLSSLESQVRVELVESEVGEQLISGAFRHSLIPYDSIHLLTFQPTNKINYSDLVPSYHTINKPLITLAVKSKVSSKIGSKLSRSEFGVIAYRGIINHL